MDNILKMKDSGDDVTLLASRSLATGKGWFPQVPPGSPSAGLYQNIELDGAGKVYSFTIIHPAPKTGLSAYVLSLVDYDDGVRVFGRLERPTDQVRIGMAVRARASRGGDGNIVTYHFVADLEH